MMTRGKATLQDVDVLIQVRNVPELGHEHLKASLLEEFSEGSAQT